MISSLTSWQQSLCLMFPLKSLSNLSIHSLNLVSHTPIPPPESTSVSHVYFLLSSLDLFHECQSLVTKEASVHLLLLLYFFPSLHFTEWNDVWSFSLSPFQSFFPRKALLEEGKRRHQRSRTVFLSSSYDHPSIESHKFCLPFLLLILSVSDLLSVTASSHFLASLFLSLSLSQSSGMYFFLWLNSVCCLI